MKEYKTKKLPRYALIKVICDDCMKVCTNSYFDILVQASFSNNQDNLETVCYVCYEKHYKPIRIKALENYNKSEWKASHN